MSQDQAGALEPAQNTEVGGAYARYVLVLLVIVYVFNFIDRQILSILAEDIKADLGVTDAQLGFLFGTAFAVFYAVFGIPLGRFADVWNRTRLISIGLAFWSAMTALSAFARSFGFLAFCRFGVGIGEASATPAANSLLSDYFPPRVRATVLSIYSSGIYIGSGIGVFLGGLVVDNWNAAFPDPATAPMGLAGWQAAFLTVGLPGVLLAIIVYTVREPARGLSEGIITPPHPTPFKEGGKELLSIVPPLTLFGLYQAGAGTAHYAFNIAAAAGLVLFAIGLTQILGDAIQWAAIAIGLYAAFSWSQSLFLRDKPTFVLMFGCRSFWLTLLGFPFISFVTYGVGFWTVPYLERAFEVSKTEIGTFIGLGAAIGGWMGVTLGGVLADRLAERFEGSRYLVGIAGAVACIPPVIIFLLTNNIWVAYLMSFLFSALAPFWIGPGFSAVMEFVLPRMRAVAVALFLFINTLIGLALGPYTMGRISDTFISTGMDPADSLRMAMLITTTSLGVAVALLLLAWMGARNDLDRRDDRARAAGEPI